MLTAIILAKIRTYLLFRAAIREAVREPLPIMDHNFGYFGAFPNYFDLIAPERHLVNFMIRTSSLRSTGEN